LRSLRGRSLRLALEKPGGWEYKLFAQALKDEIDDASELRLQQRLGLSFGVYQHLTVEDIWTWKDLRMAELSGLLRASEIIINENLEKAFGPPGVPGDLELIGFCSKSLGQLYREAIEWSLRVRRVAVDERFLPVIEEMTNFSGDLIEKIGTLGPMILETIEELEGLPKQGVRIERKIMISTHLPRVDEALKALERFRLSLEKA
jgi:hypothetical protein